MVRMRVYVVICTVVTLLLPSWAEITVPITDHWGGGFKGDACFDITEEMSSWTVFFHFSIPINSLEVWVADVTQTLDAGQTFVLSNQQFNGVEHIGDQLCINFIGHGDGDISPVMTANITGGVAGVPTVPGQTLATERPLVVPTGEGYPKNVTVLNDHGDRLEAEVRYNLNEDIIGFICKLTFSRPVTKIDLYNGIATQQDADGFEWTIMNSPNDNPVYPVGKELRIYFFATYSGSPPPKGVAVLLNMADDHFSIAPLAATQNSKYNYADVLYKSILFYEAQRSGKLPDDNRITWRGDSALDDKGDKGEDLTGGWYDAGDHVKFNFPMAYTVTALAWGILEFKDAYQDAGQLDWALDCIKWPLDYLLKCHTGPTELYVQVGDAGADHGYWGPPELMTMARPAYKITASNPGSDVAMETAAAMAAGYLVFKDTDPSYASTLLTHAEQLWDFGKSHPGFYSNSVSAAAAFYKSNNYTDETCWGSNWLFKATGDQKYLAEAEAQWDPEPAWGQSWDEKTIGNQILLYQATGKDNYKQAIINSLNGWFPGGGLTYTPKGLAWRLEWGSLRYSSNMAMAALVAAEAGINPDEYRHWAMCQIHYVLGDTGFSYVVGFGDNYPLRPHHRSSSCPTLPSPCGGNLMGGSQPNVHTLYGAMVGGPGSSDDYTDDRSNYVNNEVACDYNAGMQGAVAGLHHLLLAGTHPEQTGSATCPYS